MEGESLRAYVHRFNKEAMQINRPKEDITLTAFMAELRKGDFLYDLCKDPPKTLSELMYEAWTLKTPLSPKTILLSKEGRILMIVSMNR